MIIRTPLLCWVLRKRDCVGFIRLNTTDPKGQLLVLMNLKKDTEKIPRETVSDKHETRHCIMPMEKGFLSDGSDHQKTKAIQKR